MAIEIRYMYVQFWLTLKEKVGIELIDRKVAGAQEKKNNGESERMKTRNEAKKKEKSIEEYKTRP